jgi:large subunit ribosomal protein L4
METKIANIEDKIFIENLDPTLNRKKRAIGLIHRVYLTQLKNARKHTASTKTRSEVRGGGRKPWKQKGTGNARAGSTRSPLFVGGGVIFGPRPRIVSKKINKKERRLAILSALYLKKQQFVFTNETVFTDFNEVKTKNIKTLLSNLGLKTDAKILFILSKPNKFFWLATRNLKNIQLTTAACLNIEQLLSANHIVLSNTGLELINSTYGKNL